jgi:DNA gyrase subunit A
MRYPVVNGQGNFGSVDGDPPAAMRYTEAKLHKVAEEMLKDINKETIDFGPNYDDTMQEPLVLPAAFPYLLTNGASGIAVGMATNIPPHNLREVCSAIEAIIDNPKITVDELVRDHIHGPDFPTAGIIFGRKGIKSAYKTGKGRVTVRARCVMETTKKGKDVIIVTEIPYAVNKASLIVRIADLVKERKIDGISDLRDESDRDGMRIVIELKKGTVPKVVLNQLFMHTQLQQNFSVNSLALVNGRPKTVTLKEMLQCFVDHRKDVVIRRTKYELKKAEEREHILEGLKIALDNIDEVIAIIKKSKDVDSARRALMDRFALSERQSQAILDMRLQKLTSLETQKNNDELKQVRELIAYLKDLLSSEQKILQVVKDETAEIAAAHGDDRRTEIVPDEVDSIDIEDLIQKEDMVVLISNRGFIKRVPLSSYKNQGRGGKGSSSANLRNEDFIEHIFIASTHDYILFITNEGKSYWIKVHEIPEASKAARGQQVKALLAISPNEEVTAIVSLEEFSEKNFIFMATSRGVVKKVTTAAFANARSHGIIALKLDTGDRLVSALLTSGSNEIICITRGGNALRFHEDQVRAMGRASRGVQGMKLDKRDELAGILRVEDDADILLVSEFGYGKRTSYANFSPHGRGTRGQVIYKANDRTGEVIGALSVREVDEIVCIASQGNAIKLKMQEIPLQGKTAQGVRVVNIDKPDFVVGMARVVNEED